MKKLNIAMPITSFLPNFGGMEIGLHNIACGLKKKGHNPIIISSYKIVKELKNINLKLPYEVKYFPPKIWSIFERTPIIGFNLLELFFRFLQKKYNFDFWHITMGYPLGVAFIKYAEKNRQIPYLIRCVGEDIQKMEDINYGLRLKPNVDKLVKKYLPQSTCLIAISESVKREYKLMGINDSKIKMIPNGVSIERFNTKINIMKEKDKFLLKNDSFVFLCVSRNHPKKNIKLLILAAFELKKITTKKFQVLIVGKGVSDFNDLLISLKMESIIVLNDQFKLDYLDSNKKINYPSDEIIKCYQIADSFVFPSLIETFGIVIVEAMAAKLPVIVSDAPGCKDIVRNKLDGIVFKKNNKIELVNAMQTLLLSKKKLNLFSERSKECVKKYDWEEIIVKYENLYRELIDKKK